MKSELMIIPGVGKNMAEHLIKAGYPTQDSLKEQNPDDIYAKDCLVQGRMVDRCALYCYRLAVCYAKNDGVLPEGRKNWWNWKD